jgi:multiple sugar transport system permease protein
MAITENISVFASAPASEQSRKRQSQHKDWTGQSLVTAIMLVCLVYFLLPLFWLIVSATKTNSSSLRSII